MSIKYLSPSGLTEVWSNIKTYIASKIPSKIITGLSIKGRTITYTNSDGTTGTLTTQDTDTTYTSMSAAEATTGTATTARSISAKVLHDKITSITNTKANDSDVVHKSGNETITGVKTFSERVSFPSGYYITTDTNDNSLRINRSGSGHGNNYKVIIQGDTGKFFAPNGFIGNLAGNADTATKATKDANGAVISTTYATKTELNSKANDNSVVHKSGTETIDGLKTFNFWQIINMGLNVKWITGNKEQKSLYLFASMNDKYEGFGAQLVLHGDDAHYGMFNLMAKDKTNANVKQFIGSADGSLTWGGKTVLTAGNGVTLGTDQTITGAKTFALWTTFSSGLSVTWITGHKERKSLFLFASVDDNYRGYGAELQLHTETLNGGFNIIAKDKTGTNIKFLSGDSNGSLTWDGKTVLTTGNGVTLNTAQTITGTKTFSDVTCNGTSYLKMTNLESNTTTPTSAQYKHISVVANNGSQVGDIQFCKRADGSFDTTIYTIGGSNDGTLRIGSNNAVYPINNKTELGTSSFKWKDVYAATIHGNYVICTDGNAFMAQKGGYTFLIRNDGSNTYLLMSDKDGTPGTWSTARPLMISNATGVCSINGNANSATYATTQATSDNSTKIATTAWVRTYVNSVVGSGSVGGTITAFWGSSSSTGDKWAKVSGLNGTKRVSSTSDTFTPVVGQIYSGNQLYSTATANGSVGDTGAQSPSPNVVYARLDLSGAFNSSYKYLCTTAVGVEAKATVDVTGNTVYSSSGPYTTITSYTGFTKAVYGGKSTFLRVQ